MDPRIDQFSTAPARDKTHAALVEDKTTIVFLDHNGTIDAEQRYQTEKQLSEYRSSLKLLYQSTTRTNPVEKWDDKKIETEVSRKRRLATDYIIPTIKDKKDQYHGDEVDTDGVTVLPHGRQVLDNLRLLQDKYHYKFVSGSSNGETAQQDLFETLQRLYETDKRKQKSTEEKDAIKMPDIISIMACVDHDTTLPEKIDPIEQLTVRTEKRAGRTILSYPQHPHADQGKHCRRAVIMKHLGLQPGRQHIVIDDGPSVIKQATEEGYTCYQVDEKTSLLEITNTILAKEALQSLEKKEDEKPIDIADNADQKGKQQTNGSVIDCTQRHRQKLGQPVFITDQPKNDEGIAGLSLEKETPDEIVPGLFLGNLPHAEKCFTRLLEENNQDEKTRGGFVILRCTTHTPTQTVLDNKDQLEKKGLFKALPIKDLSSENIGEYFDDTFNFIENALKKGKKVLVHCDAGASRSPTIVAAYLIRKYCLTAKDAITHIKAKRPCVDTGNFTKQLEDYANAPRQKLIREFLANHQAAYRSGCTYGLFSYTRLNAYTKDENGVDKGFDIEKLIDHARQLTFFRNKNRAREVLEEMKIMDKNGLVTNDLFKVSSNC